MVSTENLKYLGLNEKNKWILHDDNARSFLEYCAGNLNCGNILTENELIHIKQVSSELKENLQTIELNYNGFFTITKDAVEEKEKHAKQVEIENQERLDRITKIEDYIMKRKKKIQKIHSQDQYSLSHHINAKVKKLEEFRQSNYKQTTIAARRLQTNVNFLFQLPSDHIQIINQICECMNTLMKKKFNVKDPIITPEIDRESEFLKLLTNEKNKIIKLQEAKQECELNLAGIMYAKEHIDEEVKSICMQKTRDEKRIYLNDWYCEEESIKLQQEIMIKELQMLNAQHPCFKKVIDDFCQKKKEQNR